VTERSSEGRILTTHTGSLPRPVDLAELMTRYSNGEAKDKPGLWERVAGATSEVLKR
jgi:5-methyltetrahydropteroyltriglutamate--homocysteine methyltransferase